MFVAASNSGRGILRRGIRRRLPSSLATNGGSVRNLNLHEYPSMQVIQEHGIRTPRAFLASDPEEVREIFSRNFSKGTQFYIPIPKPLLLHTKLRLKMISICCIWFSKRKWRGLSGSLFEGANLVGRKEFLFL